MDKRFSIGKTLLLGFGFFGVSVIWSVYNAYVPIFLANKFNLQPVFIGFFMTLDNIAALLIQPPIGAWSDRLRTPLGRRMPFILVGAPLGALAFGLIPLQAVLPLFVACTSTLLLSMALWRTPVIALMPDITPSRYRSQANGIINFMGGIGAIIAYLFGADLYDLNPAYPFWLGSALVIFAALMVLVFIREPKEFEATDRTAPNLWAALKNVWQENEKSPLRVLFAILCWFIAYNAIEAFFTLYAVNHLGMSESDGARLLGQLSLFFVIMAVPAGLIGGSIGRRRTIMIGIVGLAGCMLAMFLIAPQSLSIVLTRLPVLGNVPVIGIILMVAGISWALININSLPMVVDMTDDLHIGTYTGLYYMFSGVAAILGPNLNGLIIQLSGSNYASIMIFGPIFMVLAFLAMAGVRRGEARGRPAAGEAA